MDQQNMENISVRVKKLATLLRNIGDSKPIPKEALEQLASGLEDIGDILMRMPGAFAGDGSRAAAIQHARVAACEYGASIICGRDNRYISMGLPGEVLFFQLGSLDYPEVLRVMPS